MRIPDWMPAFLLTLAGMAYLAFDLITLRHAAQAAGL